MTVLRKVLLITALAAVFCLNLPAAGGDDPVFALVLSGGGARGFAHIAVLEELERRGITPDIIIGSSMGGLIGGLYSAGYSAGEIYDLVINTDLEAAVYNLSPQADRLVQKAYDWKADPNFTVNITETGLGDSDALLDDARINLILHQAVCRIEYIDSFDDLPIPFRATGTDYQTGEGIIFDSGSLYEALRGTMSMPFVFPALVLDDGTYVVDGGVYNNLPIDTARQLGADIVLAVDVNESVTFTAENTKVIDSLTGSLNQYLTLVGQMKSREQYEDADYVLIPDTGSVFVADFSDPAAVVETGRDCVRENEAVFDELEKRLVGDGEAVPGYSDLPYQTIEGFSFSPDIQRFSSWFDVFIGSLYDEQSIEKIDRQLNMVRLMANKMTVSYKFVDGIIHVSSRDYLEPKTAISIGLSGGAASWLDARSGNFRLMLNPDFTLSVDFWLDQICITPALRIGQENTLSLSSFFYLSDTWGLELGLRGAFGGMSALSDRLYMYRYPTRDWNFAAWADLAFLPFYSQRLDLLVSYDYYILSSVQSSAHVPYPGPPLWEHARHSVPQLTVSYSLDSRRFEELNETGLGLQASLSIGWDRAWFYTARLDFDSSIRLTEGGRSSMLLNLSFFSSRGPDELLASYVVTQFGQLTKDYVDFEVLYRCNLSPDGQGLYFMAGGFMQALCGDDIVLNAHSDCSLIPFAMLDSLEAGAVLGLGFVSSLGDISLVFHASFTGRMSLALSVE